MRETAYSAIIRRRRIELRTRGDIATLARGIAPADRTARRTGDHR